MKQVSVSFHENGSFVATESAYLYDGNILLSIYDDCYYFRVFSEPLAPTDGKLTADTAKNQYKIFDIPATKKISPERLATIRLLDFVREIVNG